MDSDGSSIRRAITVYGILFFNSYKMVFGLKLSASPLDHFKFETKSSAKRTFLKAALLSALRDTWRTKKLSVSGNNYGAWRATSVNNTWGHTQLAGPCVIGPSQVLTSSTKKGDGEHECIRNCVLRSTESHFTAPWPCSGFTDFFWFSLTDPSVSDVGVGRRATHCRLRGCHPPMTTLCSCVLGVKFCS